MTDTIAPPETTPTIDTEPAGDPEGLPPLHRRQIAAALSLPESQIAATARLLSEGATIPFIARYRKEATGSLDEVAVAAIRDEMNRLAELDARRQTILKSLTENGHLTDELEAKVKGAETLPELEDIYLPYRPKRRTKAAMAREKGLAPLAEAIFAQAGGNPQELAADYIDPEKEVPDADSALEGARHIIAEQVAEDADTRSAMRELYLKKGEIRSAVIKGKEEDGAKFRDYFDWTEPASTAPSHRVLAMRRGEQEDILHFRISPPEEDALKVLESRHITGTGPDAEEVRRALHDAWRRLLSRSMETEIRLAAKEKADTEAIRIFTENLRELLLASPLGAKRIMGIDPGFRTGCKLVCLDRQGKLLAHDVFYLHQEGKAKDLIQRMAQKYRIEAVAVGNGTAGRETEAFVRRLFPDNAVPVALVNESGASIYSASEIAREEFPDLDLTVRGAVSIARRLMDPLAELVKIDPKSIGVGQYQHDVDQNRLKQGLDDVVMTCVNRVGVDVNRASARLLSYVAGLGPSLASNIVAFRDENGPFPDRRRLLKVKRLGPKAFEQCAGFLRVPDGDHPLDASAVHPERYKLVEKMAGDLDCTVSDMMKEAALREQISLRDYVSDDIGMPTLTDIMAELARPGRDPREEFQLFSFSEDVNAITDLEAGMKLPGIVTNVTAFGAFVDVGVHQDGLVHISELADRFVKDPNDVVKVQQEVEVTVLDVDVDRKRISLSMRSEPGSGSGRKREVVSEGAGVKKKVGGKGKGRKPVGKGGGKPGDGKAQPFHNPFAELLGKK